MITIFRNITISMSLLILAACQTSKTDGPTPGEIVSQYNLSNVTISVSEEYTRSFLGLKEEQVALIRDGLQEQIKANLSASLPPKMAGEKPATVQILLTHLGIASAGGRILFGADSTLKGTVTIVDDETSGLVLTRQILATEKGARKQASLNGNPLLGLAINLVINAANSSDAKRVANISKSFDLQTNSWLVQKKK